MIKKEDIYLGLALTAIAMAIAFATKSAHADEIEPLDPFKVQQIDSAVRHSKAYRDHQNAHDTRDLRSVRKLIENVCEDKRERNMPLPERCTAHE